MNRLIRESGSEAEFKAAIRRRRSARLWTWYVGLLCVSGWLAILFGLLRLADWWDSMHAWYVNPFGVLAVVWLFSLAWVADRE